MRALATSADIATTEALCQYNAVATTCTTSGSRLSQWERTGKRD